MSENVTVIRKAHFNAAHRLYNPAWSDARNTEVFGKCSLPNYHGHNYVMEVEVTGPVDPETGYVIDLGFLSQLIKNEVEARFDHKNLNLDTAEFANLIPTVENIVIVIYRLLRAGIDDRLQLRVKLFETERNVAVYPALP